VNPGTGEVNLLNQEMYLFEQQKEVRMNMEEMDKRIMEVARNAVKEYLKTS